MPTGLDQVHVCAPLLQYLTDQEHEFADRLAELGLDLDDVAFVVALDMETPQERLQ